MSVIRLPIATVDALRNALDGIAPETPVAWIAAEEDEYPEIIAALEYADGAGLEVEIHFAEKPSNAHFVGIGPAPDGGTTFTPFPCIGPAPDGGVA